jgi:DNA-binding GntR family transcriptional regulator
MKKISLTSHELGYYKQFYPIPDTPYIKKKPKVEVVNKNKNILFLYLEKVSSKDGTVILSQKDIAEKLDVSVQTVRRWQHNLVSSGLLEKIEDHNSVLKKPITYRIIRHN